MTPQNLFREESEQWQETRKLRLPLASATAITFLYGSVSNNTARSPSQTDEAVPLKGIVSQD